jgi:hypothetical protein
MTLRPLATGSAAASAALSLAAAPTGELYVCGRDSGLVPMPAAEAAYSTPRGFADIFVMKLADPAYHAPRVLGRSNKLSMLICGGSETEIAECPNQGWAPCPLVAGGLDSYSACAGAPPRRAATRRDALLWQLHRVVPAAPLLDASTRRALPHARCTLRATTRRRGQQPQPPLLLPAPLITLQSSARRPDARCTQSAAW